jgi:hypothetical protein
MDIADLPTDLMHTEISHPRQDLLDRLEQMQIPTIISQRYTAREEKADALDGALAAAHIELHIRSAKEAGSEIDLSDLYEEVSGWHICYRRMFGGPFFATMKETFDRMGLSEFYTDAIDYVLKKKEAFKLEQEKHRISDPESQQESQ